ncbi:PD-(D/E)XK nuclease family protein [Rubritepida flocculans]|uniref:PD-(D/E)XK nuclease family protein n=1 Tax=Rubritepida flocculans TaxID=182403 RepID=UPI00042A805A|nr:PD-(D/E)XK nuclease family protein [Rubritepida flocculans]
MRLYAIAPGQPFLAGLARGALARLGTGEALAAATILLPTRRASRALQAAFLREADAPALLLPRLRPLAGLSVEDADELALPALLDLPPAVEPLRRQAVLAAFAARWPAHRGGPPTAEHAWALGGELGRLLDEIALEEAEPIPEDHRLLEHRWLERLEALAPERLATHWQITTLFLRGAVRAWQEWLDAQGLLDIGVRRVMALRAQRRAWEEAPPRHAVIAAGIGLGGTIPAAADLLRTIATRLPQGFVVLAGEDPATAALPDEALAEAPTHPFAGQRAMLRRMGAAPGAAEPWIPGAASPRAALLGAALLPAGALGPWQRPGAATAAALEGLSRLEAADAQHEAAAIALALRGALETPGARAALVTPDRDLARRVAAELPRHGILADDSAGQPLSETPAGGFLRLIAAAVAARWRPVALLALLKHPLCAAGMERPAFLRLVHALEVAALRGVAPAPGPEGLRPLCPPEALPLLDALEAALAPLPAAGRQPPAALLEAHLAAAEALAATPSLPGGLRLYAQAEGEALARHLAALPPALAELPPLEAAEWPGLFDALLAQGVTRAPRVARGREGAALHPQVEILGLLEARLLDFDLVVLGALDETIWPQAADPGPWMSRPMRAAFGLPSPEGRIGRVAADFLLTAANARRALLSRAARRGGAPSVPARWLTRLDIFLSGQGLALPAAREAAWARALDAPGQVSPCQRPAPRPPRAARPRSLWVTDLARLIADPYAVHARHVLGLRPLEPLEQAPGAADYGMLVHRAMQRFLARLRGRPFSPAAARAAWEEAVGEALRAAPPPPPVRAIWAPRLARIGEAVILLEAEDRRAGLLADSVAEIEGGTDIACPGGVLQLKARADRLDLLTDGTLRVVDVKTGTPPERKEVETGGAPQLPLEALIAERGGFPGLQGPVSALEYWRLQGGLEPGERRRLALDLRATLAKAEAAAIRLAGRFLFGDAPFLAQPHPRRRAAPEYRHLARSAEWSAAEGEEG